MNKHIRVKKKWSSVAGKLHFTALSRSDYPAIGDWVIAEFPENSDRAIIHEALKRKTVLTRKKVESVQDVQILATNVDTVFITSSVNSDLNIGRLERYLTFAWDSGVSPVILLSKFDLFDGDIEEVIIDLKTKFSDDDKGRHTTTSRSLYESILRGLIIDTPGMRELQFADQTLGLESQFGDIVELILKCRYTDCQHLTGPGCEILKALENEVLDHRRWRSFKKILAEIKQSARKKDHKLLAEDRKIWKKQSKQARINMKLRRRGEIS